MIDKVKKRNVDFNSNFTIDKSTITEVWSILLATGTDNPETIRYMNGLPKIYDFYQDCNGVLFNGKQIPINAPRDVNGDVIICTNINFNRLNENNQVWLAVVNYEKIDHYSMDLDQSIILDFNINSVPYEEPVEYCYDIRHYDQNRDETTIPSPKWDNAVNWSGGFNTGVGGDGDAKKYFDKIPLKRDRPIKNTAKDFLLGITASRFNDQLTFTQVLWRDFNTYKARLMIGTVNRNSFYINGYEVKKETALLTSLISKTYNKGKIKGYPFGEYVQTDYVIQIQKNGWYTKVVNAGLQKLIEISGQIKTKPISYKDLEPTMTDDYKDDPITEIAKLDEIGSPIKNISDKVWYKYIWTIPAKQWLILGTILFDVALLTSKKTGYNNYVSY